MAEYSYLWDNPGTGDSPAGGYGNGYLSSMFAMLMASNANRGVLLGRLNDLEVTDGGGLNASVDTGAALCNGVWFESDAAETVVLPDNSTVQVVVRASWATQTSRLAQVAALVQNPGVTYDIPLAEVTTLAGVITLITDTRDYCVLPTVLWPFGVTEDNIVADAVTTAIVTDQTRWLDFSVGSLEPDLTNPATWGSGSGFPYKEVWEFSKTATNGVWLTFRVPPDISGATVSLQIRTNSPYSAGGSVRWGYSAWIAQPSAVLANTAGAVTLAYPGSYGTNTWLYNQNLTIDTPAVTAGDIVHLHLFRDGAHGGDTLDAVVFLWLVRIVYTADN